MDGWMVGGQKEGDVIRDGWMDGWMNDWMEGGSEGRRKGGIGKQLGR